ncbi:MAG: integrase domain-containing protein, partial [Thauera sp.]|nr:integrase domain-containing protein [Thauera sp.]
ADRKNGAVASERTFRMQIEVVKQFCRTLHGAGLMVEDPANLDSKHIDAVFDVWVIETGLSNTTLQNQKPRIKQFFKWLGKPQLSEYVGKIETRYKDRLPQGFRAKTVADESKSWRGAGLDVNEIYRKAMELDVRFGAMLMMERAFGLRKKEVLLTNPWRADKKEWLDVRENIAKGGRRREVLIREGEYGKGQRRVLEFAKKCCKRWETLAWPELSFEQAQRRYFHLCERVGMTKEETGMTGHGLRAGFAEDMMLLDNILPPVLGGVKEMSDKATRDVSKLRTSKAMGHNRLQITHAYYCKDVRQTNAGDLLGYRYGAPMVLSKDAEALLWVSEEPRTDCEDVPPTLSAEQAELAYVTVQVVSGGEEIARLSVEQFLEEHPLGAESVELRLRSIGLGDRVGGGEQVKSSTGT